MDGNNASITAKINAFCRGYHAEYDEPKIFDDFLASKWFPEEEKALLAKNLAQALAFLEPARAKACRDEAEALAWFVRNQGTVLSRARYAEDVLEASLKQGIRQYVLLGAGFDTFAFRRPELMGEIRVLELDHPATQELKGRRIAELGWPIPPSLHFIPVDFLRDDLAKVLEHSPFDPEIPTLFSWLGVTYYLPRETVFSTLRTLSRLAGPGSRLLFDFMDEAFFQGSERVREIVRRAGEPMQTGFTPSALRQELSPIGLQLREVLPPAEIQRRYFQRTDGYVASEHIHFAWAEFL